jgi:hypothetical protein
MNENGTNYVSPSHPVQRKIYNKVGWFRSNLDTIRSFKKNTIPKTCQFKKSDSTLCRHKPTYICTLPLHEMEDCDNDTIHVCGYHVKAPSTEKHYIRYKLLKQPSYGNVNSIHYVVTQQVHSPDTYLEYCSVINDTYTCLCMRIQKSLDSFDQRAIQVGDIDGSYPNELNRLESIIGKPQSVIGFDLYRIYKANHDEIMRLRKIYLTLLEEQYVLCTPPPEVIHFSKYNTLTFSKEDICSICLENVHRLEGGQLKQCKHTFHNKCLTKWLSTDSNPSSCPCCRKSIQLPLFNL